MIRMNPYYFYNLGLVLNPLQDIRAEDEISPIIVDLYVARNALDTLFGGFYPFRACVNTGDELQGAINEIIKLYNEDKSAKVDAYHSYRITSTANRFQTILAAEMQNTGYVSRFAEGAVLNAGSYRTSRNCFSRGNQNNCTCGDNRRDSRRR
jgi:hypothetical protein